jgi:uncharacterized membrane protein
LRGFGTPAKNEGSVGKLSQQTDEKNPSGTIPRLKMQNLSDLIFGLALSIGALTLISQKPTNLIQIEFSLLFFGFSFYVLSSVWIRYSRIMSVIPVETGPVVAINIILLFLVSIEPYLYNLMIGSSNAPPPGQLYLGTTTSLFAADMGSMQLILAYFSHQLASEDKKLVPKELLRNYRLQSYTSVFTAALFLISILPIFWSITIFGIQARFYLWASFAVVLNLRRLLERRPKKSAVVEGPPRDSPISHC